MRSPRFASLLPVAVAAGVLALPALVALPAARAQTVFDNGSANNSTGYWSDPIRNQFMADTFSFASSTTFNSVTWFGGYYPSDTFAGADNFTISLYNTTAGVPNIAVLSSFTLGSVAAKSLTGGTFTTLEGQRIFQYSASLGSNVTLGAGTYGIGIVNTTGSTPNSWLWAASSLTTGTAYFRTSPSVAYGAFTSEMAFRLVNANATGGADPEPGSLALLLPVMGAVGMVVRRRKK